MERLTKRQAAIVGTYTEYMCGSFSGIQEYIVNHPGFEGILKSYKELNGEV